MKKAVSRIVLALLLAALLSASAFALETVVGTLDKAPKPMNNEHPGYAQCQLGSVCADAFRACAGADIALVNIGDLDGNLFQGDVTMQDICEVFPFDRELAVAGVTPRQLCGLLEQAVSGVVLDLATERVDENASQYGGFCHVSGITLRYDASAPVGERVLEVKLPDGTILSPEDEATLLSLCASRYMLEGGYGFPAIEAQPISCTQRDALADYVSARRELPEDDEKRIVVVGARQGEILGAVPKEMILVCGLLLCAALVSSRMKLNRYRDEYGKPSDKL